MSVVLICESSDHALLKTKKFALFCRNLLKWVILPGRPEKDSWSTQLVRVGCTPSNWRHCCTILQEMGPPVVLPPFRYSVCGLHPWSGRRCGWSIIVQQDPSQCSSTSRTRHFCACVGHLAGMFCLHPCNYNHIMYVK
jgi:hypothetical protein